MSKKDPSDSGSGEILEGDFTLGRGEAIEMSGMGPKLADDETGGSDRGDRTYRAEGWDFLLAGGGVYDHLDFSFTPGREDGTAVPLPPGTPGGGGPTLRKQLQSLKEFMEGFDFVAMAPDASAIRSSRIRPVAWSSSYLLR